jgi:hypothetical protein
VGFYFHVKLNKMTAKHLFILSNFYLAQEHPEYTPLLDEIFENEGFSQELQDLYEGGYIDAGLEAKGFNTLHVDPRKLKSKQLGFRLVETIKTLYTRKDFNFVNFIPFQIKTKLLDSLVASLNTEPTDVIAEFQRTVPKEEVVVETVQEEVEEVEAVVKPKSKSKKKA